MIKIKHNIDHAIRDLKDKCKTVIPRAAVSAMNKCAFAARKELQAEFKKEFKNRTPWAANQIVYQPAKLSQWPKLRARVGTKFKAAEYQVEGGTKEATKALWNAIPVGLKANDLETRLRRMPKDLLKKKGYKLIHSKGRYFVAYKKPFKKHRLKVKRSQIQPSQSQQQPKKHPIQIMYEMRERIEFKPRWDLEFTVRKVFEDRFEKLFKQRVLGS
jgi:hypothetical protein